MTKSGETSTPVGAVPAIADLVQDLRCMRTAKLRDAVVQALPSVLAGNIPRHRIMEFDVDAIVRTSIEYKRFDDLMSVLRGREGDSPAMRRLDEAVQKSAAPAHDHDAA